MTTHQALAVRRGVLAGAALAATLAAHWVAGGVPSLTLAAPILWGTFIGLAILCGRRAGGFRPRGAIRTMALLVVAQAALHVALSVAPWAFGLTACHGMPLVTPGAALAHLGAAVALGALLARGERLLAGAVRLAATVGRLLVAEPPRGRARGALVTAMPVLAPRRPALPVRSARGPPLLQAI